MPDAPTGIAGVFDRSADTYDAVGVEFFGPIARGLAELLAASPGERCLDVGCGRGALTRPLAQAVGPGGGVEAIDLSPRMVELTADELADRPWVGVRVGDAASPGFPSQTFDVVGSSLVLFFLPDPLAAVRAWRDLLAPGGRLGVTTFGAQDERWEQLDAKFAPYLPPRMRDARTTGRTGPFTSDAGMEQLLADAGLADVRTETREVTLVADDAEQYLRFSWSVGQRAMWEAVPQADLPALRDAMTAALEALAGPDGRIALSQQVRHTLGVRPG